MKLKDQLEELLSKYAEFDDDSQATYFYYEEWEKFETSILAIFESAILDCIGEDEKDLPIDDWARTDKELQDYYYRREIRDEFRASLRKKVKDML